MPKVVLAKVVPHLGPNACSVEFDTNNHKQWYDVTNLSQVFFSVCVYLILNNELRNRPRFICEMVSINYSGRGLQLRCYLSSIDTKIFIANL